jgi:hypothetical protein
MPKRHYRVRNWKEYNKALISRGSVLIWLDEKSLANWYQAKEGKKGRPLMYSDVAISLFLLLKQVYRLSLRSSQGFLGSLFTLFKLELKVPSYTQVCRRQQRLELPSLPVRKQAIHIVVDASGLKVFGEGEWKVRQHGICKRRCWRKLHIAMDEASKLIVSSELKASNYPDDKLLAPLLDNYLGKISQVSGDGIYDSHACFETIAQRGAKATIPPQPHPLHPKKKKKDIKRVRDEVVWQVQQRGYTRWKRESGYHRRSLVENAFFRYKRILGDKLMSHTLVNQRTEALIRCHALNKMTLLGMPISIAV